MKILYLDCFAGISGDMALGALIDAGVPLGEVESQLTTLGVEGYTIQATEGKSRGIRGVKIEVHVEQEQHHHRTLKDILQIIENSSLDDKVKKTTHDLFQNLAQAEAKVHGVEPEQVHFHEVGAIDSIIDITGFAIALYLARIEKIYSSRIPLGYGSVQTMHGLLPVPAPAAAELLKGVPLCGCNVEGEMVTPTGAAIISTLCKEFGPLPTFNITRIGYGLGSKDFGIPNFLRVFIGDET